jgi:hypothetical protein
MKCHDRIVRLAETVGASLDHERDYNLIVDAPAGYVWDDNFCSTLCEAAECYGQTWHTDACNELASRMRMGLTKCDPQQSAEIAYDRDELWTAPADAPETLKP